MAGAKINVLLLKKIDVASEVRTNCIEGLNLVAGAAKVNCADGDLGEFVPGIDTISEHGEFARDAVVRECFETGDAHSRVGSCLATQWVEEDLQACQNRDDAKHSANDSRQKALKEITPSNWRRRFTRIVHN